MGTFKSDVHIAVLVKSVKLKGNHGNNGLLSCVHGHIISKQNCNVKCYFSVWKECDAPLLNL